MDTNRLHIEVYYTYMMTIANFYIIYMHRSVHNLLQQIKESTDLVLLICPQKIADQSVDDKFFRIKDIKEDVANGENPIDSQTVFERMMLTGDWKTLKEPELSPDSYI